METSKLTKSIQAVLAIAALATPAFAQDFEPEYIGGYPTKETSEQMFEEQDHQAALRRGWYFGNQAFCERLLKIAVGALKKKARNPNYQGKELRDHGEKRAEEIVNMGLRLTGLKETGHDRGNQAHPLSPCR